MQRSTPVSDDIANISAPEYFKDLFRNFSRSNPENHMPSNEDLINAVRYIPGSVAGEHCLCMCFCCFSLYWQI